MKVTTTYDGQSAVVLIEGRLDAEWAGHLAGTLDELLRAGVRSAVVDLAAVSYVSSAGARVLTTSAREFAALRGELLVAAPPSVVVDTLGQAGLEDRVILPAQDGAAGPLGASGALEARGRPTRDWRAPATNITRGSYEMSAPEPGAAVACRLYGDAARVARGEVNAGDCHAVSFRDQVFGVGVGALGDDYNECGPRMGELLGAAGVAAFLPTDGARVPDYLTTLRGRPPCALLASGLTCEGHMSHLVRFAAAHRQESVALSELGAVCLDAVAADAVGVVIVAEAAGLVGASRRLSPASSAASGAFALPALREWLTFTAEPAFAGTTVLVTGVITRNVAAPWVGHLRPLVPDGRLGAHLHAAVFSYRPVPQRTVALQHVVAWLFEEEMLRAVLHLLADERRRDGAGESRFVRGLVWASRVQSVNGVTP